MMASFQDVCSRPAGYTSHLLYLQIQTVIAYDLKLLKRDDYRFEIALVA